MKLLVSVVAAFFTRFRRWGPGLPSLLQHCVESCNQKGKGSLWRRPAEVSTDLAVASAVVKSRHLSYLAVRCVLFHLISILPSFSQQIVFKKSIHAVASTKFLMCARPGCSQFPGPSITGFPYGTVYRKPGFIEPIWVCLKIVYPYTQWLMIIIPTKWL